MSHIRLVAVLLVGLIVTGCGAHRMAPVDPRASGDLKPSIEDADGGLVGVAPGFSPKTYSAILVEPFTVATSEIKDDEDARLAKDMAAYFQTQLVTKLQTAKIFARVIDATVSSETTSDAPALRVEGDITKLTEGSRALRYFVGFGTGAAKAQIETRFVDTQSRRIQMVTADRRAAGAGIFGGEGRQFVTESMDQMADGLVKMLKHLSEGGQPGLR